VMNANNRKKKQRTMQNVLFVNPVICISNRTREHTNDGIAKLISTPVH
jgi:hypothetical protein